MSETPREGKGKGKGDSRRGPQGVQGIQGIEGIEGPGKQGEPGAKGERGEKGTRGNLPRNVTRAFVAVVVIAFLVLSLLAWQIRENRRVARSNRALIARQLETRSELVRGFKRADIITCREVEKLKAQARETAVLAFSRLDETLGLLELGRTAQIVAAAKRNRDEALARYQSRDCGHLPPP